MVVLGNILLGIYHVLHTVYWILFIIILVGALLSWVRPDPYHPVVRFVNGVTETLYRPIRRLVPTNIGGFDIAPLIVILIMIFINYALLETLQYAALRMRLG
jgi:YggT family protein